MGCGERGSYRNKIWVLLSRERQEMHWTFNLDSHRQEAWTSELVSGDTLIQVLDPSTREFDSVALYLNTSSLLILLMNHL